MKAENQQRIVAMAWANGDYDVAQEITQELYMLVVNEEGRKENPSFVPVSALPDPKDVEEIQITTDGVWFLIRTPVLVKKSINWLQIWKFMPLHRLDQVKLAKTMADLSKK